MEDTPFQFAPPIVIIDGLTAVPIDVTELIATFVFDASAHSAEAEATITFVMGDADGYPVFDLRQTVSEAWLDGASLSPSSLSHHDFGGGAGAELRIIQSSSTLAAGSTHSLRLRYALGMPQAPLVGSYLPDLSWAGDALTFNFGFTDLGPGRYLESWLPANLIYDQFALDLTLRIVNSTTAHSVITNGSLEELGTNHWRVLFPDRFTACSHLLELRASHTLTSFSSTAALPSGDTVTVEVWGLGGSINLAATASTIHAGLANNESEQGAYIHGAKFVAFMHTGGMEYDGATTTSIGALSHELFHSWWGRGVKPASQNDGWWDEGYTVFYLAGPSAAPINFGLSPVSLSSRNPWNRTTPNGSYSTGAQVFRALAHVMGVGTLTTLMANFYALYKSKVASTERLEAFLLCASGEPEVVDIFHRFVYGFGDPVGSVDVWLKDHPDHAGQNDWEGHFWNSPDLWIRRVEDDGGVHQSPEFGQDNWFYARVRNRGTAHIDHFAVTFKVAPYAGVQFNYKEDFLPATACAVGFDLAPGETRVVKARWPRNLVPTEGTHACLVASVICRGEQAHIGSRVWEHNNLAQKNLTVVDLDAGDWLIIPFVISNHWRQWLPWFNLESMNADGQGVVSTLLVNDRSLFKGWPIHSKGIHPQQRKQQLKVEKANLDCGYLHEKPDAFNPFVWSSKNPFTIRSDYFARAYSISFEKKKMNLPFRQSKVLGWKITVPRDAKPGEIYRLHLVKKNWWRGSCSLGGISAEIHIKHSEENKREQ